MATPLRAALDRAVAAGILTPEQAGAIVALDETRAGRTSGTVGSLGLSSLGSLRLRNGRA
jgi:hypothetical protein